MNEEQLLKSLMTPRKPKRWTKRIRARRALAYVLQCQLMIPVGMDGDSFIPQESIGQVMDVLAYIEHLEKRVKK